MSTNRGGMLFGRLRHSWYRCITSERLKGVAKTSSDVFYYAGFTLYSEKASTSNTKVIHWMNNFWNIKRNWTSIQIVLLFQCFHRITLLSFVCSKPIYHGFSWKRWIFIVTTWIKSWKLLAPINSANERPGDSFVYIRMYLRHILICRYKKLRHLFWKGGVYAKIH